MISITFVSIFLTVINFKVGWKGEDIYCNVLVRNLLINFLGTYTMN